MDQVNGGRMKNRRIAGFAAMSIAAIVSSFVWVAAASSDQSLKKGINDKTHYMAYYFYTTRRCMTCKTIEQFAQEAIKENFKDDLKSGKLQWQALNVDMPKNKHFIKDFQLYTKSVIVAEYNNGKPVRWENLSDVWQLSRDKQKFIRYVARETQHFMEKK
jgi:hypothetical protein